MTVERVNEVAEKLTAVFLETLSRCEHCGHSQDVFVCDDCHHAAVQFSETLTDAVNLMLPGRDDWRFRMDILMRHVPKLPKPLDFD